jgi:restriction endonuclease S subunit
MTEKNGELPKGWKWIKLGDILSVKSGSFLPAREMNQSGRFPVYGGNGINGYHNEFMFEEPQIVIGRVGALCGCVQLTQPKAWITDNALYVDQKKISFDDEFMAICLTYLDLNKYANSMAQPVVSAKIIYSIEIPLPPLPEQKRIVAILNEQMAAVEKARAAAEAQLQAAKTLPAAYLREVFDSPEAQKWQRKKLGEVCKIIAPLVDPKVPEYGILPHVNGENIESGTCRLTYLNTAFEEGMTSGKYLFDSGDILYTKLRPYLRKVAVVDFQGLCSADTYPIKVDSKYLDNQFTGWLLVSDTFTNYANEASARARMPKLNREQLFAWETPIPPIHEQKAMAEKLNRKIDEVKSLCETLQDQLNTIKQLPPALLRQAFNGEL